MSDTYYSGELAVVPPMIDQDQSAFTQILKLNRIEETESFFASVAASPDPDLPYHGDLLEVSEDGTTITPEEGESRAGVGLWLRLLTEHFFKPRGYRVSGNISYEGDDPEDRATYFLKDNQMEHVYDEDRNPGPSWHPTHFADERLKTAIKKLVDSSDGAGCDSGLTVVSAESLEALKAIYNSMTAPSTTPAASPTS